MQIALFNIMALNHEGETPASVMATTKAAVARAEIVRKTRSLVFIRGQLTVGARVVLAADGIWKILSPRGGRAS